MLQPVCRTLLQPFVLRASRGGCPLQQPVPICFVRYRKNLWSPLAPTKLFRVRQRTPEDPQEKKELFKLYTNYRTSMKALSAYLREELAAKEALVTSQLQQNIDQQHHDWCLQQNDVFNQTSARCREERETREAREHQENLLELEIQMDEQLQQQKHEAAEQVRKVKEEAANFITVDCLDAAIEAALNTRRLYNFAIDVDGNRYVEQSDGTTVIEQSSDEQQSS